MKPRTAEFTTETGCRVIFYSSEWAPGGWVMALKMSKDTDIGAGVDTRHVEVLMTEAELRLVAEVALSVLPEYDDDETSMLTARLRPMGPGDVP